MNKNYMATTPSITHLKALLVLAVELGHVWLRLAIALQLSIRHTCMKRSTLNLHARHKKNVTLCLRALLGLQGARKAWDLHPTKELIGEDVGLTQTQSDGWVNFNLGDGRETGPQVDDFPFSGPHAAVERKLGATLDLRDVVRLCDNGSCGILLGMEMVTNDGRVTLRRLASHVGGMARELGMTMTMTMTHSEKSHINQMRAWPYRQECRGHGSTKKNLSYW